MATYNVTTANGVGLDDIDTHEGSCKDNGDSSNTATSIILVMVTTPHAKANSMRGCRDSALLTQHHTTATQVVTVHDTALLATASAMRERQYGTLATHNEMGCVHRKTSNRKCTYGTGCAERGRDSARIKQKENGWHGMCRERERQRPNQTERERMARDVQIERLRHRSLRNHEPRTFQNTFQNVPEHSHDVAAAIYAPDSSTAGWRYRPPAVAAKKMSTNHQITKKESQCL